MATGRTTSLKIRATLAIMAIILIAVGTVSWIDVIRSGEKDRENLLSLTQSYASSISVASELPLAVGDTVELERLASAFLMIEPEISFIAIYGDDEDLQAIASRDEEAWGFYLEPGTEGSDQCILGQADVRQMMNADMFGFSSAFDKANDSIRNGYIVVGISPQSLVEMQVSRIRTALFTMLGAIALSGLVVVLVVSRWTGRLQVLVNATKRISDGDLTQSIQDDNPDELGVLVRAFEGMREAIDERDRLERSHREELTAARQDAENANMAKSQFLAHMSHEIRTPLNGVIGMLELLHRTELESKQQRFVRVGRSSADALLDLINSILDFSKIEAGQLELESIDFDVHGVIESVGEMLAPKGQAKGLEVVCDIGSGVPSRANGDPARFRQIILNLLNNAIKFTDEGEVVVRATLIEQTETTQTVRVSVSDTGIGIPPESRDRLFKSFSQVDASTTRKFGGTGLGLAICKSLSEIMGGSIGFDEVRRVGSEFWFTVEFARATSLVPEASNRDLKSSRVLVVDDNQTNREILLEALSNWQAEAVAVEHAVEALEVLRQAQAGGRPFTMAILDMQMPDVDGLQLADAIQSDPEIGDFPILMLSSIAATADSRDLENAGIQAYLPKPVRLSQLYETMIKIGDQVAPYVSNTGKTKAWDLEKPYALRGRKVLVAEDNTVNQMVIVELLKQVGVEVEIASNGQLAVEKWQGSKIDAVLMDCEMPIMDGLLATQKIREIELEPGFSGPARTPIIALTANAIQGDRDRCLAAGMDEYLTKPVDPALLITTLTTMVLQAEDSSGEVKHLRRSSDHIATNGSSGSNDSGPGSSIDVEEALARCGGNRRILSMVFAEFTKSVLSGISDLASYAEEADFANVSLVAHSLKGATANISAPQASELASEIERLGRESERQGLNDSLEAFRLEIETVLRDVEAARAALDSEMPENVEGHNE